MSPAPQREYRIHAAAEQTGLSEVLIRAWERRYAVVEPRRTPAGYRVYTELDLALLRRLKQLTSEGVSIAEAAKLAPTLRAELEAGPRPVRPSVVSGELPIQTWQRELLEAAARMDQPKADQVLDAALGALPPVSAFDLVLVPVLVELGERWHSGAIGVAEEHLMTQAIRNRLASLLHGSPRTGRPHVLLACFPDEQHEIGLLGAALRFRHGGARVTVLGQRSPTDQIARVAQRLRPDLIGLSAITDFGPEVFRAQLTELREKLPARIPVLMGGAASERHADICAQLKVKVEPRPPRD